MNKENQKNQQIFRAPKISPQNFRRELISLQIQVPKWKRILEKSVTAIEDLPKICSSELEQISEVIKIYPMCVNPYYLSLIKEKDDAIYKQCIPSVQELKDNLQPDPLAEERTSPVQGLIHRYPDRVLLSVSNKCAMYCRFSLLPKTKILMDNLSEKNIEEVKKFDKIISHKGKIQCVYEIFKRRYNKPILQIKSERNLNINITEEHPLLVLKRKKILCNQGKWRICKPNSTFCKKRHPNRTTNFKPAFIYAKEIVIGDYIATPILKNNKEAKYNNSDLAYLMGLYLAEGDLPMRKNGDSMGVRFSFGHKEEKTLAKIAKEKAEKISNAKIYLKCYPKKSVCYVRIFDKKLAEIFKKELGKYSSKKRLSKEIIFNSSDQFKLSLLKGYLDGDGTIYTRKSSYGKLREISFATASRDLASQIFMILTQLGFMPSLYISTSEINKRKWSSKVKNIIIAKNPRYCIRIGHKEGWNKWFKINGEKKYQTHSFNIKDYMFSKVTSIKRKNYNGLTYDLSVEKDESYVANFISVHNCTRKRKVGTEKMIITKKQILAGINYIECHPEIRDVVLSGGDPLMLEDSEIEWVLKKLKEIKHVEIIRIGTRVPCSLPQRITPELCNMLKKYHPLYINTHFNHPDEITEEAKEACELLADAGIPLGNQSVLLKGINDDPAIMKKLVQKLLTIRIKPYYIYQADMVKGTNHFRTKVSKGIEIIRSLRGFTSGMAVPHYVIDSPEGGGKIPLLPEYLKKYRWGKVTLRNYKGEERVYIDP